MPPDKLRLSLRKRLIEDIAPVFDHWYAEQAKKEVMLFTDPVLRQGFPQVVFSETAMLLVCGKVRLMVQQCADGEGVESTREFADCIVLKASDASIPLAYCRRAWQLKGAPAQACSDCNICAVLQARHTASLALLQGEMAKPPRYTALRCLMRAPPVNKWRAYERGELFTPTCTQLSHAHSNALLIDTHERLLYLCESQALLPMITEQVQQLATTLGLTMTVHPLAKQWESLSQGRFPYKWCMLFSEAMALALVRATDATTPDAYLATVYRIMHGFMRRMVGHPGSTAAHAMSAVAS